MSKPTGLYDKAKKMMASKPTALVTQNDISKKLNIKELAARDLLFYLYRDGQIQRHVDKKGGHFQYAKSIPKNKSAPYKKNLKMSQGQVNKHKRAGRKKTKGKVSIKEIRSHFATTMNNLAKLEDMVISAIEAGEEDAKLIAKMNRTLNG